MSQPSSCRAGVDIGGTFTDVALEFEGVIHAAKVLTDYEKPERAIVEGLLRACEQAGIEPSRVDTVIHGTTLATNALIARQGARTAFITTDGFRDVIETRNEGRFEQYDLSIELPAPLVPRRDRYTINARMDAQGGELVALDLAALDAVIAKIAAGGYESVAVGLMHSYRNGAHERQVRERVLTAMPTMSVSISSEVSPQIREFERFNTVCANAYVKPLMSSYLNRLKQALGDIGMQGALYLIHSGGGLMALDSAAEFPVRLLESGPAGGAIYAKDVAQRYALDEVLSFDMGGTTAKICLIEQAQPKTSRSFEVARTTRFKKGSGMPISIPVIDMVEIGAGGGSIATVDDLRQVRVGPASAGSEPGPACYGRGGTRPTVTDADLVLAKLDPERFAGGSMKLDGDAAVQALREHIAKPLGGDAQDAAHAVGETVDENMANAARMHAVENGRDLSGYTMVAYGGAAPLHAIRLCEKLGIDQLLVPPGAGVGSAIGFLRAPFSYESLRSAVTRLNIFDPSAAQTLIEDMHHEIAGFLQETGQPASGTVATLRAYMRYVGQGTEIAVDVPTLEFGQDTAEMLRDGFTQAYVALFGHGVDGLDCEVVSWALSLRTPDLPVEPTIIGFEAVPDTAITVLDRREVFDAHDAAFHACTIYEREALPVHIQVAGPCIVTERETSTYVSPGFSVARQSDGCLLIRRNPS